MATNLPPIINRGDALQHLSAEPQTIPFNRIEQYALFHCRTGVGDASHILDYFGMFLANNTCFLVDQNGQVMFSDRNSLHTAPWVLVRYLDIGESLTIFGSAQTTRNLDEPEEVALPMPNILKFGPEDRNNLDEIPNGVPYWVTPNKGRTIGGAALLVNDGGQDHHVRRAYVGMTTPQSLQNISLEHRSKDLWTFDRYAEPSEIPNNIQNRVTDFGLRHSSTSAPEGADVGLPVGEARAATAAPAEPMPDIRPPSNVHAINEIPDGVPFLATRRDGNTGGRPSNRMCVISTPKNLGRRRLYWYDTNSYEESDRGLHTVSLRLWTFTRFVPRGEHIRPHVLSRVLHYFNDAKPSSVRANVEAAERASVQAPASGRRVLPSLSLIAPPPTRIDLVPDGVPYLVMYHNNPHQAVNILSTSGHRRVKILKRYVRGEGYYLGHQTLSSRVTRDWVFNRYLGEFEINPMILEMVTHLASEGPASPMPPEDLTNLEAVPEGVPFIVLWGFGRDPTQVVKRNGVLYNQDVNHLDRLTCSEQTLGNRTRTNWVFDRYMRPGEPLAAALLPYVTNRTA